jgi:hypothetical protein
MMFAPRRISYSLLKYITIVIAIICSIGLVLFYSGASLLSNNHKMGIVHIVMFEFKPEVAPKEIDTVSLTIRRRTAEQ